MNAIRIIAIALILSGVLGLVYGGITYNKKTTQAQVGNMELSVDKKETVNIPVWAGVGAIVLGSGLLLIPTRKS